MLWPNQHFFLQNLLATYYLHMQNFCLYLQVSAGDPWFYSDDAGPKPHLLAFFKPADPSSTMQCIMVTKMCRGKSLNDLMGQQTSNMQDSLQTHGSTKLESHFYYKDKMW